MKYHFVYYEPGSEEKIYQSDTDEEPPSTGDVIHLHVAHGNEVRHYLVKEVYFAPESQTRINILIEIEPM